MTSFDEIIQEFFVLLKKLYKNINTLRVDVGASIRLRKFIYLKREKINIKILEKKLIYIC